MIADAVASYNEEIVGEADVRDIVKDKAYDMDYVYIQDEKQIILLNNKYYDLIFRDRQYTKEELFDIINNNESIKGEYKTFICEFTDRMLDYYPEAENRVYAENLKRLRINENATSDDTHGYTALYNMATGSIEVSYTFDLENTVMDRVAFRHELGHMFTDIMIDVNGYTLWRSFKYHVHGKIMKEALDVIFTVKPFEDEYEPFEIDNYGYPIPTNIAVVILDYLKDYDFQTYVSGGIYTLEKMVNERAGKEELVEYYDFNYIEDIIELQYAESDTGEYKLEDVYYNDMYRYITDLYLISNNVDTENIDEEELRKELREVFLKGTSYIRYNSSYKESTFDYVVKSIMEYGY